MNFHYLAEAQVTESSNLLRNRISNNNRYTKKENNNRIHKKSKIKRKLHYIKYKKIIKNHIEINDYGRVQSPY